MYVYILAEFTMFSLGRETIWDAVGEPTLPKRLLTPRLSYHFYINMCILMCTYASVPLRDCLFFFWKIKDETSLWMWYFLQDNCAKGGHFQRQIEKLRRKNLSSDGFGFDTVSNELDFYGEMSLVFHRLMALPTWPMKGLLKCVFFLFFPQISNKNDIISNGYDNWQWNHVFSRHCKIVFGR